MPMSSAKLSWYNTNNYKWQQNQSPSTSVANYVAMCKQTCIYLSDKLFKSLSPPSCLILFHTNQYPVKFLEM